MRFKRNIFLPVNLHFFDEGLDKTENIDESNIENVLSENEDNDKIKVSEDNNTERLNRLIQDAVKRETKKITDENKKLTKSLEKLQKEKLSEDEIKQFEIDNKIAEIAEREKQLTEKENRFYAIKAIKAAGIDDGSEDSLELIDFVMSNSKDEIDSKVKSFSSLINKFVKAEVERRFKDNGRIPGRGTNNDNKENDNIAVQLGKITAQDNEKAKNIINSYLR